MLERRIGDSTVRDCGRIEQPYDTLPLRDAHGCVAEALNVGDAFSVLWHRGGIDSRVARAYLGLQSRDGLTLESLYYDGDPGGGGGDGRPVTLTQRCQTLRDLGECDMYELWEDLCFECRDPETRPACRD